VARWKGGERENHRSVPPEKAGSEKKEKKKENSAPTPLAKGERKKREKTLSCSGKKKEGEDTLSMDEIARPKVKKGTA